MEIVQYTTWLGGQALSALEHFWPLTVGLSLVAILVAARCLHVEEKRTPVLRVLWTLLPFVLPILILAWGSLQRYSGPVGTISPDRWQGYVVWALVLAHIPLCGLLVRKLRGLQWVAVANSALAIWCSWWVGFVSVMSITGDWV